MNITPPFITTVERFMAHLYDEAGLDIRRTDNGGVTAESPVKYISIDPHKVMYQWHVEAIDDPEDSDSGVSSSPTVGIINFIKSGLPGGEEMFGHLASNPNAVSVALRVAINVGNRQIMSYLRRILAAVDSGWGEFFKVQTRSISKLKSLMEAKGWDVQEISENEIPVLEFKILDQFSGNIRTNTIEYKYKFEIKGHPDTKSVGISNNPSRELLEWDRSPDVESAVDQVKAHENTQRAKPGQDPEPATIRPSKPKS